MAAAPDDQLGAGTDPVILRESRLSLNVLFGGLLAVLVAALARGLAGAQTAGGRAAVAVIFGAAAALAAWAWVAVVRRRGRLEITGQAITYADGKGQPVTLSPKARRVSGCKHICWKPCPPGCTEHRGSCPRFCEPGCTRHAKACPQRKGGWKFTRPKGNRRRTVPIPVQLIAPLRQHFEDQDAEREAADRIGRALWPDLG